MKTYLVRHAKAGSRSSWDGPDEQRPLSKAGRRQAKALAKALRDEPIFRVVSSPYVRCIETVEPVAELRGLPVEEADELTEGTPVSNVLRLIEKVADKPTVLCTHGDVVENLLTYVRDRRLPLDGEFAFPKGSTWVLDREDGEIARGRYLPPTA